ncbi:MAG: sigma-70 family RNA polymerase sigma factor [Alphaproteobacteria bacterium]|nr:sigma-70 family RNA polymerase sigma factor [Alphaproteobacteria bacterium]
MVGFSVLRQAFSAPILTREREYELARRWIYERDQAAVEELANSHLRLVASVAGKYRRFGLPRNDLMQEGVVGLMQAASRFDPDQGVRFATYAIWWIQASIRAFVARNTSIVHNGSRLNVSRLANERGPDQSLDAPTSADSDMSLEDMLVDDGPTPEETAIEINDRTAWAAWMAEALQTLTEREQRIIRARHLREKSTTLAELGEEFGISKERVRQIEKKALRELRRVLESRDEPVGASRLL